MKTVHIYNKVFNQDVAYIENKSIDIFLGNYTATRTGKKDLKNYFNEIYGDLNLHFIGLTSLEGAPEIVHGHFNISSNKLSNLKHFPKYIGGSFLGSYNNLTSLEGICKNIEGSIILNDNKLICIKHIQKRIKDMLNVNNNQLTDLKSIDFIGEDLCCRSNYISSFENLPKRIDISIDIRNNPLKNLIGYKRKNVNLLTVDNYLHTHKLFIKEYGSNKENYYPNLYKFCKDDCIDIKTIDWPDDFKDYMNNEDTEIIKSYKGIVKYDL